MKVVNCTPWLASMKNDAVVKSYNITSLLSQQGIQLMSIDTDGNEWTCGTNGQSDSSITWWKYQTGNYFWLKLLLNENLPIYFQSGFFLEEVKVPFFQHGNEIIIALLNKLAYIHM